MRIRAGEASIIDKLRTALKDFNENKHPLIGIDKPEALDTLVLQIVDSIRRIKYIETVTSRDISDKRANPDSELFDPILAAAFHAKKGDIDEAMWLSFLSVHFGKSSSSGWKLCSDIYGGLGQKLWSWKNISSQPGEFTNWYKANAHIIANQFPKRKFSNHRKYESLDPDKANSTHHILNSYVLWVGGHASHIARFAEMEHFVKNCPKERFDYLYKSMKTVKRFGRLAKFDFLTLISKLNLINIEPPITYMKEATGPLQGAALLVYGAISKDKKLAGKLEGILAELGEALPVERLVMQVLEDSLCNWQKSPTNYKYFSG